ncbi:MAG: SGNH/GDSL hydrolase family protein [Pseudomonadales bacterium]
MIRLLEIRAAARRVVGAVLLCGLSFGAAAGGQEAQWVGTWATAGSTTGPFDAPVTAPNDQTIRHIARISVGGKALRVWLSNAKGTAPLTVGAVSIGVQDTGAAVQPSSLRAVTFGGAASVTIAPGAKVLSDAVNLAVADLADLAISVYLPDGATDPASPVTNHVRAIQTAYVLGGDQTGVADPFVDGTITSYFYLTGVDVTAKAAMPVIAVLGDSIANGDESTPDANQRWPNLLAERIHRRGGSGLPRAGVLNLGISGNQVTATLVGDSAQARLDRDVLTQTGVTHLIVMAGINDLGLPGLLNLIGIPTALIPAEAVIAGYQQIIARAKARGLVVIGGTLTPSGGFPLPDYFTPAADTKRQQINDWIRSSGAFDHVIDFDAVLRDPANPALMRADLTADGLHPNDAGYQAMADAVPLKLFRPVGYGQRKSR